MKFYRNHYGSELDPEESTGFVFFTSKAGALRDAKGRTLKSEDDTNLAQLIDIPLNKAGILRSLNHFAGHPDNG